MDPRLLHPLASALCVILLGIALTGTAQAETLFEVFRQAEQFDPRWSGALNAHRASQERPNQGYAGVLPSVTLNASAFHYDANVDYPSNSIFQSSRRYYDTVEYGLTISHPLYRRQNFAQYQQSIAQADLGDAQLSLARAELISRVAQAYFDALAALDNMTVSTAEVSAFAGQLEQAKDRFSAGAAAITDVYEAQSRYDLAIAREIGARNDSDVRRQALRRIMGRYPGELSVLRAGFVPEPPKPNDIEKWVEIAHLRSEQLKVQQQQLQISHWDVERTRAAHYPVVDLAVSYSSTSGNPTGYANEVSDQERVGAGIQIQVPLYQGGGNVARLREAFALKDKAWDDLEDRWREVEVSVRQTFLAITNGSSQIRALEQALASSESVREASQSGLAAGVRTQVDVLNAEQQVFNTKRELARARYEYLLNLLKLKALAGAASENDLAEMDGVLGDTQHAHRVANPDSGG